MHTEAMAFLKNLRQSTQFAGPVLEIGSININGSARDVFGNLGPYHGVDIVAGPNVDYVLDVRDITDPSKSPLNLRYQTIISTEVLEHVDPQSLVPALFQFMHGRCQLIITCAGPKRKAHSADGAPALKPGEYYGNVEPKELQALLMGVPKTHRVTQCMVFLSPDETDVYAHAEYVRVS